LAKIGDRAAPPFPIVECFGFDAHAASEEAQRARKQKLCPFAGNECEKLRQYGFGYCSVTYAARDDDGQRFTYAVCDYRLDGEPLHLAISDAFGDEPYSLAQEVVLTDRRTSLDSVACDVVRGRSDRVIAIETQAIDLRGGGVGPAWRAWGDGKTAEWRRYFTEEAARKGRRDTVAYGVNMANIYKRLGLQVATKGVFLKAIDVPFYVVMQDRPFQYLHRRVPFAALDEGQDWDISFMTFDYDGTVAPSGMHGFSHVRTIRTTLSAYTSALPSDHRADADQRADFIERVLAKAQPR
jgi:hypothetical protein